ncbi:Lrp/AsnC family transcriptional regulator [Pseudohaliea sp.]|uniref:Lrp/AsnC family transcriptional regulator n=1 Tax=Pseudohaliea sp. TaxID=2740289 RepID=UPI0032F00744
MKVDRQQERILVELQLDGRISNAQLAEKVAMSESSCLRKTRALEEAGVIAGYRADVDPKSLGLKVSAYILVNLDQRSETVTREFFEAVAAEPRIVECVALTGQHDLMLKVVASDIDDLADLTMGGILSYATVKDIASCVVLKNIKAGAPLLPRSA